jgi:hypothetical protein
MAQKLNHYRVVVKKDNGVLVTYDESAVSIEVVIRHAPFALFQIQQIEPETGMSLEIVYPPSPHVP